MEKNNQEMNNKNTSNNKKLVDTNLDNTNSNSRSEDNLSNIDELIERSVEKNIDYGYGNIDVVWNVSLHRLLPHVKWGFIKIGVQGNQDRDLQDNQYSQRKIEEAIIRGLRSGMDRVYLIADNEDMARSISGKVEWLSSFGSIIRFDTLSLGLAPNQEKSTIIVPSQERVPEGEKLRKKK